MKNITLLVSTIMAMTSVNAVANINLAAPIDAKVIEAKHAMRKSTEEALQRYMEQRKQMQTESRLKSVEKKISQREASIAARLPI